LGGEHWAADNALAEVGIVEDKNWRFSDGTKLQHHLMV
jgi:hypothetical protein